MSKVILTPKYKLYMSLKLRALRRGMNTAEHGKSFSLGDITLFTWFGSRFCPVNGTISYFGSIQPSQPKVHINIFYIGYKTN